MTSLIRFLVVFLLAATAASAQTVITGMVRDAESGEPLSGITVIVKGMNRVTATKTNGTYSIQASRGNAVMQFKGVSWITVDTTLNALTGDTVAVNIVMQTSARNKGDVVVYAASRRPEKLTEAPTAVSVVTPEDLQRAESHGQLGKTMEHLVGVDVVQSGSNDFNINARGFNNSINRRMLVLIDGRDPSTPLINLNEWNSVSSILGDVSSIEVIHGPGSALYGQNAYNGVVNIRTSAPKEVLGTRFLLSGGEWETYRAAVRHAGELGDLSYKVNFGMSHQLNYSLVSRLRDTTKPLNGLEYAGLAHDVRPLTDEQRRPFSYVATARFDYDLGNNQTVLVEGGMSHSGNDFYVNQTGRILIQEINRPFVRAAFQSENINVQGLWQRRFAPLAQLVYNANATSGEQSDVFNIDAQWNDKFLDDKLHVVVGGNAELQKILSGYNGISPLISPDNLTGEFYGMYGQAEFKATDNLKFVGALRVDGSNIFETQISPKAGIVFEPSKGQSIRATYNRSFLRPSFADLYRKSPAGLGVNLSRVDSIVNAETSAKVGAPVNANLGLGVTPQWNLGNPTLTPEKAQSFELGYKGQVTKELFIEVNGYYNRRTDLISAPLGGITPDVYSPVRANTGNAAINVIADSILAAELAKVNSAFPARLSVYEGKPALVVSSANIAVVDELGCELAGTYYLTNEVSVFGNWTYIDVTVKDNTVQAQRILPNTARHRLNGGIEYVKTGEYDAGLSIRYVEGFKWIAGTFEGNVPAYAVVNLNAGYNINKDLRIGLNVFNLLDRRHYEIFGGTILQRQVTGSIQYSF